MTRRAFSVSVYVHNPRTGQTLLVEHVRHALWLPLGGEHAPNETPLETARRKLQEESGWDPDSLVWPALSDVIGAPPGLLHYEEHASGSRGLHCNFVFLALFPDSGKLDSDVPKSDGSWASYAWGKTWEHSGANRKTASNVWQALSKIAEIHVRAMAEREHPRM